jgi:hypothetical protein
MRRLDRLGSVAILALVAALFCAPLFRGLQSMDQESDEAIYSYAVESILETGDWLNPRTSPTTDTVFLEKPPLKFWIVALPIRLGLLPDNDFGLRFWDALFGAVAFLYVFAFGRRLAGWPCGVAALLILYTIDSLLFNHGLRSNNMEASVVLCYAGGLYHYLRWAESHAPGRARAHAAAVGAYFFLGFMSKFVAALFLPAVIGAASLELPAIRAKAWRERRTWAAVLAGVVVLVAPWFVYQSIHAGAAVWSTMVGEHVVKRFRSSLDPAHLRPWYYYFEFLGGGLVKMGTVWAVVGGAALIHVRVVRERWLVGTLVLYWFWLPFVLLSLGSSKLWHYAYPFLPPVGLAAGYAVAAIANMVARVIETITDPARRRSLLLPAGIAGVAARLRATLPRAQRVLFAAGVVFLALAAAGQVFPGPWPVFGLAFRPPQVLQGVLTALLLGLLAGRGAWTARVAVSIWLLSLLPVAEYHWAVRRTTIESHPLRSTRDCIEEVRRTEQAAGRPVRDMYFYFPPTTFLHQHFFYYRHFGWNQNRELPDRTLMRMLDDPAEQRPVLLPEDHLIRVLEAHDPPGMFRASVLVGQGLTVALPGPYARCAR